MQDYFLLFHICFVCLSISYLRVNVYHLLYVCFTESVKQTYKCKNKYKNKIPRAAARGIKYVRFSRSVITEIQTHSGDEANITPAHTPSINERIIKATKTLSRVCYNVITALLSLLRSNRCNKQVCRWWAGKELLLPCRILRK